MQKYGNADAGGIFRKSGRIWIKPGEVIYFSTDLLLRRASERKRIRKRRTSVQVSLKIRKDSRKQENVKVSYVLRWILSIFRQQDRKYEPQSRNGQHFYSRSMTADILYIIKKQIA